MILNRRLDINKKIFLLIFVIVFITYSFTSHGHRSTPDEYFTYVQARQIVTQTSPPGNIPEETREHLQLGGIITGSPSVCKNGILCSFAPIGASVSYVPFVFIEHNFHLIPNYAFTLDDFNDSGYVNWRNSLSHDETFTFLFFGPFICALSASVMYLISRTYSNSLRTSTILSLFFGFATIWWAYSATSFNNVEGVLCILLGFYYYRKFLINNSAINLALAGISLGFGAIVRNDVGIFILILLAFLAPQILKRNKKIKNTVAIIIPLIIFAGILETVDLVRFGSSRGIAVGVATASGTDHNNPILVGIYSLLFSPGAGIFIYSPILLLAFLSFFDFYKQNKLDCILFLSYISALLIFFGSYDYWHGFVAWSARYLLPSVPFLLLPLASSLEKRGRIFKSSAIFLAIIGAFFSFTYVVQDTSWFVWGLMGGHTGLFNISSYGNVSYPLRMHPAIFWTFDYSQLTQSIKLEFTHLQVDMFLFKILGPVFYFVGLIVLVVPLSLFLIHLIRINREFRVAEKESNTSSS